MDECVYKDIKLQQSVIKKKPSLKTTTVNNFMIQ